MSRPAGSARNPAAASTTIAAPSPCRRAERERSMPKRLRRPTTWGGAVAFACSGRGRKLRRGLAPARQRCDAAEPLLDLLVGRERQIGALGMEQRRCDREVRERHVAANQVGLPAEVGFEHRHVAVEAFESLGDRGLVGRAEVEELLYQAIEEQRVAGLFADVRMLVGLPAAY